jgi:glycosyltransferase involved in cell wall biosynthesis
MGKCQGGICANSTFSWWGAWLGNRNNNHVFMPRPWFPHNRFNYSDIYWESVIQVSPEKFFPHIHRTLCIVTIPHRMNYLKQIVMSAMNQVDKILIYCNYPENLKLDIDSPNIDIYYSYEHDGDLGSNGKIWLSEKAKDGFVFFLDDDIQPFTGYFDNLIHKIIRYGPKTMVSYHGGNLPKRVTNFTEQRQQYDFEELVPYDKPVNIIGSGVSGFLKPIISLSMTDFPQKNKDDLYLAFWAQKNEIPLVVTSSTKKYCKGFYDQNGGLWHKEKADSSISTENTKIAASIEWRLYTKINNDYPEVDIIMPVYRTQFDWLKQAINSCLSQRYRGKINLIIVDDSGDEIYTEKLTKLVNNHPSIKLMINPENMGISKSLNRALLLTKSEYVFRMDSDDVMMATRLEKTIDRFQNLPSSVAVLGTNLKTDKYMTRHPEIVTKNILLNAPNFWCINHPTVCFRGDIIRELCYPQTDTKFPEDILCWYHILEKGYEIRNIPDITLYYREHVNNNSKKLEKLNPQKLIEVYNSIDFN